MRHLYPLFERLARVDVPVVIEGETGTGKEVVAEAIHMQGPRACGPFVVFDCTTVASSLMEAVLFGHERGAFTGAVESRKGLFEEAHGGTLFIDEIGDLDISLQPKLLRAIQRRQVRRVGGDRWLKTDVRVLAATRRDLDREVKAGRFREDLFFRLAVARLRLPPLRDREDDVALLAQEFWNRLDGPAQGLPDELLAAWRKHSWPGNVRELENAVARWLALGELAPPPELVKTPSPRSQAHIELELDLEQPLALVRRLAVEEVERRYVEQMLARHGGRVSMAAARSGVTPRYFNMLRARFRL